MGKIVSGALGPIDVVAEGGEKLAGTRERRVDFDAVHRHAALLGEDFFEAATIFAPAFDDLFHDALRPFGFARAHAVAHIDDFVAILNDADSIIVESQNFQCSLLSGRNSAYLCDNARGMSTLRDGLFPDSVRLSERHFIA